MIYDYYRVTGAHDTVLDYADGQEDGVPRVGRQQAAADPRGS